MEKDGGLTKTDAEERLKTTTSKDQEEMLFLQFKMNYKDEEVENLLFLCQLFHNRQDCYPQIRIRHDLSHGLLYLQFSNKSSRFENFRDFR